MGLRTTVLVAACLGAIACSDEAEPTRASWVPPPPLGACLDTNQARQQVGSARVEGRVEEVGLGMPDPADTASCPLGGTLKFGPPGLGDAELLAQVSWLRVRDAENRSFVLSALAEGFVFPLAAGDLVSAEIDVRYLGFVMAMTSFEVRAADGSLLYWAGSGTRLDDLDPPDEVVLSTGHVEAELESECVSSYLVRALNVQADGMTVLVPNRARVQAGRWMVVNARLEEQTGMTRCPDAYADHIEVAVWPRTAQVQSSGGIGGPCYAELGITQAEGAPQILCLPDGTLSRECGASPPCPAHSQCVQGLCRPRASSDF